jgi:hypothetical protein
MHARHDHHHGHCPCSPRCTPRPGYLRHPGHLVVRRHEDPWARAALTSFVSLRFPHDYYSTRSTRETEMAYRPPTVCVLIRSCSSRGNTTVGLCLRCSGCFHRYRYPFSVCRYPEQHIHRGMTLNSGAHLLCTYKSSRASQVFLNGSRFLSDMYFSPAFILTTLLFLTSTAAVPLTDSPYSGGLVVPINKVRSLDNNGTVNTTALQSGISRCIA